MTNTPAAEFAITSGLHVFPVKPGSKYPFKGFAWRQLSTDDPAFLAKVAGTNFWPDPNDPLETDGWDITGCNWACDCAKSQVAVVDLDIKRDDQGVIIKDGVEAWQQLGHHDPTRTHQTPRGGRHLLYKGTTRNSESTLGPGIDTRGNGGYFLLPGSRTSDGEYTVLNNTELAPFPAWVTDALGAPKEKDERRDEPLDELDTEANTARAIEYLVSRAPEAIEGDGGDGVTYLVAAVLRDYAMSEGRALELMLDHWNPTKAHPSWSPEDLATKVKNAYSYGQNRPGSATPAAIFRDTNLDLPEEGLPSWLCQASTINAMALPQRDWILGTTYINRYVTATIAPGGVGKSMLSLLRACAIASGKPLTGEPVHKKGPVVVFNAEDPLDELKRRVAAIRQEFGLAREDIKDLYMFSGHDQPVRLASEGKDGVVVNTRGVEAFIELCKRVKAVVVILDPFVRIHSVSENNNNAIDAVARILSHDICKGADCAVNVVHHSRKLGREGGNGDAETARGASSLVSAVRIAETVGNMTEKEAREKYALPPGHHLKYIRVDGAKANLAPALAGAVWFEKVSVKLANGDGVGVLKPAELTIVQADDTDDVLVSEICNRVPVGEKRLAKDLHEEIGRESQINPSINTVKERIKKKFRQTLYFDGYAYQMVEMRAGNGQMSFGVECVGEDTRDIEND